MKDLEFSKRAEEDMAYWAKTDPRLFNRIIRLLDDVVLNPHQGIGKPEPLKFELTGCWSRRINKEHRLVYKLKGASIIILACRYHYE